MKVTINNKMLSIPPYVSVAWKNIASLHIEHRMPGPILIISLLNGSIIEIPSLAPAVIETIFVAHAKYMDQEHTALSKNPLKGMFSMPGSNAMEGIAGLNENGLENMGNAFQHNREQANMPNLPEEFLNKISGIAKLISIDEDLVPKAEPGCNCLHCQIAKTIENSVSEETKEKEVLEEVSAEDLKFRIWDIDQSGDKLYIVKNPLDEKEHYSVFLGDPIGCTCGEKNCEHIQAVLKT